MVTGDEEIDMPEWYLLVEENQRMAHNSIGTIEDQGLGIPQESIYTEKTTLDYLRDSLSRCTQSDLSQMMSCVTAPDTSHMHHGSNTGDQLGKRINKRGAARSQQRRQLPKKANKVGRPCSADCKQKLRDWQVKYGQNAKRCSLRQLDGTEFHDRNGNPVDTILMQSVKEVAEFVGCHHNTVRYALIKKTEKGNLLDRWKVEEIHSVEIVQNQYPTVPSQNSIFEGSQFSPTFGQEHLLGYIPTTQIESFVHAPSLDWEQQQECQFNVDPSIPTPDWDMAPKDDSLGAPYKPTSVEVTPSDNLELYNLDDQDFSFQALDMDSVAKGEEGVPQISRCCNRKGCNLSWIDGGILLDPDGNAVDTLAMQSLKDAAALIGCTQTLIAKALKKRGQTKGILRNTWKVEVCDSPKITENNRYMIKQLDEAKFLGTDGNPVDKLFMPTFKDIAAFIGCSEFAITNALRKPGAKKGSIRSTWKIEVCKYD
jgi:hypothetical protein